MLTCLDSSDDYLSLMGLFSTEIAGEWWMLRYQAHIYCMPNLDQFSRCQDYICLYWSLGFPRRENVLENKIKHLKSENSLTGQGKFWLCAIVRNMTVNFGTMVKLISKKQQDWKWKGFNFGWTKQFHKSYLFSILNQQIFIDSQLSFYTDVDKETFGQGKLKKNGLWKWHG